jgi:hypothetical protein
VGFPEFLDSGDATSLVLIWDLKRDLETWFLLFAVSYTVTPRFLPTSVTVVRVFQ